MHQTVSRRDIVVIGGSAGAFEVLKAILSELPRDFPAAVFAVIHVGRVSSLAGLLDRTSSLPVHEAKSGASPEPGNVYVATPGRHLMLHDNHMLLRAGPREHHSRPAIDPLFRSAAATFGPRVTGLLLSGSLSDGSSGLNAIKRCGGLAWIQDPREARVSEMPMAALTRLDVDRVLPVAAIAPALSALVREAAPPAPPVPLDVRLEAAIAAQDLADMKADDALGHLSRFTCPECHGVLWEIEDGRALRYRCHVGHAYGADELLLAQIGEIDRRLGALQRTHQERAALAKRMRRHCAANSA